MFVLFHWASKHFSFPHDQKKNRKIEYTHGGHPLTFIIISSFSFTSWWRATKKKKLITRVALSLSKWTLQFPRTFAIDASRTKESSIVIVFRLLFPPPHCALAVGTILLDEINHSVDKKRKGKRRSTTGGEDDTVINVLYFLISRENLANRKTK